MAKEKVTPNNRPVPSSGGVTNGGNSTLTTPKKNTNGRCWSDSVGSKDKILK